MLMQQNILKYIFSCCLLFVAFMADGQEVKHMDTSSKHHQLRIGIDIAKPIGNAFIDNKHSYEATLDYLIKKELYAVIEAGVGQSNVDYPDLKYTTNNSFIKIGVDKSMIPRLFSSDWDMIFVGARYGIAFIKRNEASYITNDAFWGTTTGTIASKNITGHWAELTVGIRVELFKGFYAGYTGRAKFLINQKAFQELPPYFIAGYGNGEKNTNFDFNFYLLYGLRW